MVRGIRRNTMDVHESKHTQQHIHDLPGKNVRTDGGSRLCAVPQVNLIWEERGGTIVCALTEGAVGLPEKHAI